MPINKLGIKPAGLSTDKTAGSDTITTGANFQGRSANIAGQQQSESFLPAGETRHSAHTFLPTNKYIVTRNITAASENQDRISEAHDYEEISLPSQPHDYEEISLPSHDYEEIGLPSADEYVEMPPPTDDYEQMNPSSEDYVNTGASGHDYEEVGSAPEYEYVEMSLPTDDYEQMNPSSSDYVNTGASGHDYEEVGPPLADEYVEMSLPTDDYEQMSPSSENYVNTGASGHDYEEIGLLPEDEYVEMSLPTDDYEQMSPSSENYVNARASENDYEEVGPPSKDEYMEMRSFVESPKAGRAGLSRFETLKIRQLGSECGDYLKEATGDLQKMTRCANNLSASTKGDVSAFYHYLIPQHLNCINEYIRAVQILSKAQQHQPGQRKSLQIARNQLSALRNKLMLMLDIMGAAIRDKNFSTAAASNYADLKAERKSPARQVMKAQSQIIGIHRFVDEVKYRVNYLAGFPSGSRVKAKEEIDEIAFCRKSLVQAKTALPKCLSDIKKAMDKVNDYEKQVKAQPVAGGKQLTLRERRYTMHLANRLEGRIKRINNTISASWAKLEK